MKSIEFQQLSKRTLIDAPQRSYSAQELLLVWNAIGLVGEVGELLAAHPDKRQEELGDLLWYLAALYTEIKYELPEFALLEPIPSHVQASKTIAIAAAKIADTIKKQVFHDHGVCPVTIAGLLDHFAVQLLMFCDVFDLDIGAAMAANVEKLKQRYPDGWDVKRSINRQSTETIGSAAAPGAIDE